MSRSRKIVIVVVVLVLIVAAAIGYILTNLNSIVKAAIERYGSEAAGTPVRVSSVSVKLTEGSGAIEGLTVDNPPGFSSDRILSLGHAGLRIEPRSLATNVIVIDDIRVAELRALYELNKSAGSNIDLLKKNLSSPQKPRQTEDKKSAKRIRIKKLTIENVSVDVQVPGQKTQTIGLRKIEISDIGGRAGVKPDQAARQILTAIAEEVAREAAKAGATKLLEKGAGNALQRLLNRQ